MLQVIICDDSRVIAEKIYRLVEAELCKYSVEWEVTVCQDGHEVLRTKKHGQAELIFLDIEMPGMSGIEVAEKLEAEGRNGSIVFVTSHDQLVFTSLKFSPFMFVRKSHMEEEIGDTINRFIKKFVQINQVFKYRVGRNVYDVPMKEIGYLRYWNHQVELKYINGETRLFRSTMKAVEAQLDNDLFFRANSGDIVNLAYCKGIENGSFLIRDGTAITISREKKKSAQEKFMRCRRELL